MQQAIASRKLIDGATTLPNNMLTPGRGMARRSTSQMTDCPNIDGYVSKINQAQYDLKMRVNDPSLQRVRLQEHHATHEVPPYSEHYHLHPHFLLSTSDGWKRTPRRADAFTRKNAIVTKARRKAAKKHFNKKGTQTHAASHYQFSQCSNFRCRTCWC